ncbi:MAG: hypothetical protein AAFR56_15790, partial [Chloroflexota bacterium]
MTETTQIYDPAETPVTDDTPIPEQHQESVALSISLEGVVYLALAATILLMYVLRLGIVPLTVAEPVETVATAPSSLVHLGRVVIDLGRHELRRDG